MTKSDVFRGLGNNVEFGAMRMVSREEQFRFDGNWEERIKFELSRKIAEGIGQKLVVEKDEGYRNGDTTYRTRVYILTDEELRTIVHNVKEHTLMEVGKLQQLIKEDQHDARTTIKNV